MAAPLPSYTKQLHSATYPGIDPKQPTLSTDGKVVLITGASGGIGRSTAASFAASGPRALILLGRRSDALNETAELVRSGNNKKTIIQTHQVDLCDDPAVADVFDKIAAEFGGIDILAHCAGVLAPVMPLIDTDPATFLNGYQTTVVGTLIVAQAFARANNKVGHKQEEGSEITFINLTTAGILYRPFQGMGAYVSSKMAAVKLLEAFSVENTNFRLHHVHPGFLDTAMSKQLSKTTKLPFAYDDSK